MANHGKRNRLGVILSAGGSAFTEAAKIGASLPLDFCVVTDRECGAEERCRQLAIPVTRIAETDRRRFSCAAKEHFSRFGAELVLLHFSRLVCSELFLSLPCCNVHPSFLPAFPGFGAVKRAWSSGSRFLGATLHFVDDTVDMGPIVAQTIVPIPFNAELAWCERASFLQKIFLTLVLFELMISNRLRGVDQSYSFVLGDLPIEPYASPALTMAPMLEGFRAFQARLGSDALL